MMGCDGFGLYPFVVLMLGSGVALSGNGAGVGTSGITGNGVAAHARDPAETFLSAAASVSALLRMHVAACWLLRGSSMVWRTSALVTLCG